MKVKVPSLKAIDGPLGWAVVLALGGFVVYLLWDKVTALVTGTIDTAGGLVSGNNALTAGTDYSGTGVAGTLGAAVNSASGGVAQSLGESIGGGLYDLLHLGSYTSYSYSTTLHRWTQVIDTSGVIYNIDENGNITGPA